MKRIIKKILNTSFKYFWFVAGLLLFFLIREKYFYLYEFNRNILFSLVPFIFIIIGLWKIKQINQSLSFGSFLTVCVIFLTLFLFMAQNTYDIVSQYNLLASSVAYNCGIAKRIYSEGSDMKMHLNYFDPNLYLQKFDYVMIVYGYDFSLSLAVAAADMRKANKIIDFLNNLQLKALDSDNQNTEKILSLFEDSQKVLFNLSQTIGKNLDCAFFHDL